MILLSSRKRLVIHKPTSVAPATQNGVGMAGEKFGERGFARRRGEKPLLVADEEVAPVVERLDRGEALGFGGGEFVVAAAPSMAAKRRVDDRAVAGAAAKVAGERLIDVFARRGRAVLVEREQAHHDARRAKAALRAMKIDHRLLDRVQRLAVGEVLDGEEFGAVDLAEEQDTGVDRASGRASPLERATRTTVQAPQSPSAQPSFVPFAPSSSRSQSRRVMEGEKPLRRRSRPRKRNFSSARGVPGGPEVMRRLG